MRENLKNFKNRGSNATLNRDLHVPAAEVHPSNNLDSVPQFLPQTNSTALKSEKQSLSFVDEELWYRADLAHQKHQLELVYLWISAIEYLHVIPVSLEFLPREYSRLPKTIPNPEISREKPRQEFIEPFFAGDQIVGNLGSTKHFRCNLLQTLSAS